MGRKPPLGAVCRPPLSSPVPSSVTPGGVGTPGKSAGREVVRGQGTPLEYPFTPHACPARNPIPPPSRGSPRITSPHESQRSCGWGSCPGITPHPWVPLQGRPACPPLATGLWEEGRGWATGRWIFSLPPEQR